MHIVSYIFRFTIVSCSNQKSSGAKNYTLFSAFILTAIKIYNFTIIKFYSDVVQVMLVDYIHAGPILYPQPLGPSNGVQHSSLHITVEKTNFGYIKCGKWFYNLAGGPFGQTQHFRTVMKTQRRLTISRNITSAQCFSNKNV